MSWDWRGPSRNGSEGSGEPTVISFRYYLVTIVALFLALGLGVLAGTTVIDQQLIDGLRSQIDRGNEEVASLSQDLETATGRLGRDEEFLEGVMDERLVGRLQDRPVVIIASDDIGPDVVGPVTQALGAAGADIRGSFAVTDRVVQEDAQASLKSIVPGGWEHLAPALAERFTSGSPEGDDPLLGLLSDGFLVPLGRAQVTEEDLAEIGGSSQIVVVLGGPGESPVVQAILLPLTEDLASRAVPIAAGESSEMDDQLVRRLRSEGSLKDVIVTVDNANEPVGAYAMVLGLERLLDEGVGGDFGFKQGSDGPFPQVPELQASPSPSA